MIELKHDIKDKKGWKISKGTEIKLINELKNPMTKETEYIIRIDNGTRLIETMPKTVITSKEYNKGIKD